jgi:TPP-dependent pyruvate/acetoin dehydrogenase alpha subunit
MGVDKEKMLEMHRMMVLSRKVDEAIIQLYRSGLPGMIHLNYGQEATTVGVCAALKPNDLVVSTHRGKGHYVAKGGDIKALMAELMGKQNGSNQGKGGPMHILDVSVGMLGANGIVGSSLPIACGSALASQFLNDGLVTVGFFGDGAANCGPCHESMNLAAIWKLPVVFVCENNCYQVSCPADQHSSIQDYHLRAAGYGFPGLVADGMNVVDVFEAAEKAVQRARSGQGPTLLECKTYRFRGHAESDPTCGQAYRTEEEMERWRANCPIKKARQFILDNNWSSDHELGRIEDVVRREVDEAVAFAKNSPDAPADWALTDVYA